MHMRRQLLILLPIFLLTIACCYGQAVDTTQWVTDGDVHAIARNGNTLYVGGRFSYVGPNTGGGGAVDLTTGHLLTKQFPHINGEVAAVVADGTGGWFIGGVFTKVYGTPRYRLAHLLADGSLDQAWKVPVGEEDTLLLGGVSTLYLHEGQLYISGGFDKIKGQARTNFAVVNASTGELSDWAPNPNGAIGTMIVSDNILYVGGFFTYLSDAPRAHAAAFDLATRKLTGWNPSLNRYVRSIIISGSAAYLCGDFDRVGNQPKPYLAAVTLDTGQLTSWSPGPDRYVEALALQGNVLYAGGSFTRIANEARQGLAAFDPATGQLLPFDIGLQIASSISAIVPVNNLLYLGGSYRAADGQRRFLGALDVQTGRFTSWDPKPTFTVLEIAVSGNSIFAGGSFESIGGYYRSNVAALDATTGAATGWAPSVSGKVNTIALYNNQVYLGGEFHRINNQPRYSLAAIDPVNGQLLPWRPDAEAGSVHTIAISGTTAYVGGDFGQIGGLWKFYLAAVDLVTGSPTSWSPSINGYGPVHALKIIGNQVYVGGSFNNIGGQSRNGLAAVDLRSGQPTAWNPGVTGIVKSFAANDTTLFVGGYFSTIGNQARSNVAAIDLRTGLPTAWNPQVNAGVESMALIGNMAYLGGGFTEVNGQPRANLAAVGVRDNTLGSWNPQLYSFASRTIYTLSAYNGRLYVGGQFEKVGSWPTANLAAFGTNPAAPNLIRGSIFVDANGDCRKNDGERALPAVVKAEPGSYYGFADSLGNYTLAVDTGMYTIAQVLPAERGKDITQTCPASPATHTVSFNTYNNSAAGKDFGNRITLRPYLTTSVTSTRRRRCFAANTTITYCNEGTLGAEGVKLHLALPEHVVLVSAGRSYTRDKDGHYVFEIGSLPANGCGTIVTTDSVTCNNPDIRGLTQCTKVWMTPANATTPAAGWDGSDVALKAKCLTNGRVRLGLYNTGSGAMTDSSAYRMLLDAKLVLSRNFKLAAGDSLILQVPANGQTVRLEADQRPGHPTKQSTNVTLEGCGTGAGSKVSRGFVSQLPADDAEPEVDVECLPITDSFDPNDKLVLPAGITSEHLTAFGQELEYTVRFQNTGNDYAYQVVVTDTLSDKLDISTLRVAGASHPYKFTVSGKGRPVLTWTFNNINLPDSTRDGVGSNGFVKFTIKPLAGLPTGTRLENFADIFFDYNPPVRTNTVVNTLGELPREADASLAPEIAVCQFNPTPSAGAGRSVCEGDSVRLQALSPQYGQGRWKRISGAGTLGEPGNPSTFVTGLGYGDNVFEWRVVRGSCSDDSLSARITIARHRNPAKPVIRLAEEDELVCDPEAGQYQWYYEGQLLPDNARRVRADREGHYTVRIANGLCASPLSDPYAFVLTSLGASPGAGPVLLHPNPTSGIFTIVLPASLARAAVAVFDALGREVAGSAGDTSPRRQFDLRPNGAGVYLVKIQTEQAVIVKRVVVRR
ncbi:MAG: hypothetical protein AVDCRST_MAG56-6941 [uncultured Cytophagales bacterium]|uniref:Uncharacterized protein n=1 Tax=uncultured Cytophagales bacterium TaxID=158755 RepID=A0A6J4L1K0_9SPHI|nr:MAG: hypothetical protein AVDCRST_MAG56-6941 [uncultured Cytophagales bacterium]